MRPRPTHRRALPRALALVLALLTALAAAAPAGAIVPLPPHPWIAPIPPRTEVPAHEGAELCQQPGVLCPDIAMRAPYQLVPDRWHGWKMLRAANAVLSVGAGPVEVRGVRSGPGRMDATQYVYRTGGRPIRVPGGAGNVVFKPIPGQGGYWKFANAAKFELWSTGGTPKLVRTGEKLIYCLRDLRRLWDWPRSPGRPVYPACSRNPNRRAVTLGTSPGWADIYPALYYEQWIDVTGLRGCFDLLHIADPENHIIESDETNNTSKTRVRLPMGKRRVSRC
ncbi:MAG: lysyl oxidase family protein [Patulibacter minatonensis]